MKFAEGTCFNDPINEIYFLTRVICPANGVSLSPPISMRINTTVFRYFVCHTHIYIDRGYADRTAYRIYAPGFVSPAYVFHLPPHFSYRFASFRLVSFLVSRFSVKLP